MQSGDLTNMVTLVDACIKKHAVAVNRNHRSAILRTNRQFIGELRSVDNCGRDELTDRRNEGVRLNVATDSIDDDRRLGRRSVTKPVQSVMSGLCRRITRFTAADVTVTASRRDQPSGSLTDLVLYSSATISQDTIRPAPPRLAVPGPETPIDRPAASCRLLKAFCRPSTTRHCRSHGSHQRRRRRPISV